MLEKGLSARQKVLNVASQLFYQEGIRAVGVDTIVEQSGVGKATLYRHFPSKEDLVAAYLEREDQSHRAAFEEVIAPHVGSPKEQLQAWVEDCIRGFSQPGFRGCPFLNALAELSAPDHPGHRLAIEHEKSLRLRLYDLSQEAGAHNANALADQLLLVTNGALTSAPVFGSEFAATQLQALSARLIDEQLSGTKRRPTKRKS